MELSELEDLYYKGDFKSLEQIYQENSEDPLIKIFYLRVLTVLGKNHLAELLRESLKPLEIPDNPLHTLVYFAASLDYLLRTRKLDLVKQQLDSFHQNEKAFDLSNDDQHRYFGRIIRYQGTLKAYQGDFQAANELFSRAISIQESIGDNYELSRALSNRAAALYWLGDIEEALQDGTRAHQLLTDLGITGTETYVGITNNIGLIYFSLNQPKEALKFFKMSLEAATTLGNPAFKALNYHNLIRTYLLLGDVEKAKATLDLIEGLDQPHTKLVYDTSRGMIGLHSTRIQEIAQGQAIINRVIDEPVIDHQFTILAIFTAVDYLLLELEKFEEDSLLGELHKLLIRIDEIGSTNAVQPAIIQAKIIRAKLRLIEGDLVGAKGLLNHGLKRGKELGLAGLVAVIEHELDNIESEYSFLSDHRDLSLGSKLRSSNFSRVLRDIKNNQLIVKFKEREDPLFFIILSNSGMPLFTRKFKESNRLNEFLISGFLTAVDIFGRETFQAGTYAEKLQFKENSILLRKINNIVFAYGYRKRSRTVTTRFNSVINYIISHPEFGPVLTKQETKLLVELPDDMSTFANKSLNTILINSNKQ